MSSIDIGINYLKKILDFLNKKGSRLALNVKYLEKVDSIKNVCPLNTYYNNKELSEIKNKLVTIVEFNDETINVIHNNLC